MNELAKIVKNKIIISIDIETLASEYVIPSDLLDENFRPTIKIVNVKKLAKDFVSELNKEQEDGTTPVHLLFDNAFLAAVENGADGCEDAVNNND